MATNLRALKATSVVLGLTLAAAVGANFGCAGSGEKPAGSAAQGCGCGSKEALSAEDQAVVDQVRASGINVMMATELKTELASDNPPIVVDVLSAESYAKSHIPGSISVPWDHVQAEAAQKVPDRSARVVVYCASFHCGASTSAATAFQKLGYTNVYDFKGGLKQWHDLGWPLEGNDAAAAATMPAAK